MNAPTYLSYSQFTTYQACSWAYHLTRIQKVDEPPAWWFVGGTSLHSAADAVDHVLLQDKTAASDAYQAGINQFHETFAAEEAQHTGKQFRSAGGKSPEDKGWWLKNGPEMVHRYFNWRHSNPALQVWQTPDGVPAVELEVNVPLPDGTVLKAFIDRVFQDTQHGTLNIVDLKSGKTNPTPLQLAVYRLCLREQFEVDARYGGYWMARSGTLDKVHDLDAFPPDMISRWLRDVKKAIDSNIFVPKVSKDCSWCGVRDHCYAYNPAAARPDFFSDLNVTSKKDDDEH